MGDIPCDCCDFADIANQIHRREMDRTYNFNLMLVGATGIGKSTLVRSIFMNIKPEETFSNQGPKLNEYEELLEENGVKLDMHCIETSNYHQHRPADYVNYINQQFMSHFMAQRKTSSRNLKDCLVHCCLYIIPPYGKMKLCSEDIECMKALHEKVNLIPVIAKADTFNLIQLDKFKQNIVAELEANNISYFKFQGDPKEDEDRFQAVKLEASRFPFAVVAADEPVLVRGRRQWIRSTIAGELDIYDKEKCDFESLAKLLTRHCMLDLIDSTHEIHYTRFKEFLEEARLQRIRQTPRASAVPRPAPKVATPKVTTPATTSSVPSEHKPKRPPLMERPVGLRQF